MIKNSEITVIVQGPYYEKITDKVLNKIYKVFKGSKLIFSTYKDNKLNNSLKKKFKVLINKNPKKTPMSLKPLQYYNYTGQMRTTLNGLKNSKTKYCLKTRSDLIIENKNFLKYFNKYKKFEKDYKILKKKVLISSFNTINPRKEPLPFHFSDWFYFGLTEDLKKILNQKYMSKENKQVPLWFLKRKKPKYYFNNYLSRYRTEQHITINFLKKYINLEFDHAYDYDLKNIILTEKILSSNFVVLNTNQISIKSLKYPNVTKNLEIMYFDEKITFNKWIKLYKTNCDNSIYINSTKFSHLIRTFVWIIKYPKEAVYRYLMYNKLKFKYFFLVN